MPWNQVDHSSDIAFHFLFSSGKFAHTPSAVIQRGGRVSNENFQYYCATIAYHVELNAESNRSVEELQLRLLELSVNFSCILNELD